MAASSFSASLIGILDERIDHSAHTSWDINKIGGKPDWMSSHTSHPKCDACQSSLILVTQLYCPLEASLYHRTIYVFTCVTEQCQHNKYSFRVFRAQKRDQNCSADTGQQSASAQQPVSDAVTFDTDWCDDADDWGDGGEAGDDDDGFDGRNQLDIVKGQSSAVVVASDYEIPVTTTNTSSTIQSDANTLEQSLEQLSLHTTDPPSVHPNELIPRQPVSAWPEEVFEPVTRSEDVPELVSYYISVFDEPSAMSEELLSHERQLMREYQEREGVSLAEWEAEALGMSGSGGEGAGGEGYEKVTAKHGDRTFQKFMKKIQSCPQQCIRYCFSGKPLWMTDSTQQSTNIPACTYCGSQRHFEFQLMPALLPSLQLHVPDQSGANGKWVPVRIAESRCDCLCHFPACMHVKVQNGKNAPYRVEMVHTCVRATDPVIRALHIDFGVVVVYTCSQSCWTEDCNGLLREEVVVVQHDPDSKAIAQAEQRLAQIQQSQR